MKYIVNKCVYLLIVKISQFYITFFVEFPTFVLRKLFINTFTV